jgi:hypothetical protein
MRASNKSSKSGVRPLEKFKFWHINLKDFVEQLQSLASSTIFISVHFISILPQESLLPL